MSVSIGSGGKVIERAAVRVLVLLLSAAVLSITGRAQIYASSVRADLDHDGKTEIIDLNSGRDATLQVWHGGRLLWQGVPKAWKPWKLAIADIDGDGKLEIIVGVTKSTKFFPKPHNCLFIYGWKGARAFPKWLGSSLGRPFTDFLFADLGDQAGEELIALETTLEGNKVLAAYRWNSFGFTLARQSGQWRSAKIVSAKNGRISLEADGERIFLANDLTRRRL